MHTKRQRDDDSDSEDERYLKRSRPWNMQTNYGFSNFTSKSLSPPRVVPGLEAMTPAESEHSEADSPTSIQEEPLIIMSPHHDIDYAMHVDEDESDQISSQPPDSPFVTNFRPAKLNFSLFSRAEAAPDISSRIPTPIYPSFNTGALGGLGYPNSGMAGGMTTTNGLLGVPSSETMQTPHRRQRSQDRTIRMPSPISEDEDIPDTPTALTQSQLSRLSVTTHHSSDRMDTDMGPPATTPTRGRKRSGALTGMGRFSMGYRDDCEKCRLRVPGHYSHFL
ncbi:hypothetical protein N0V90_000926 [Kalmusia sp. IMI 367209]|nr:hypothetical protein N0V90_000926 [Kalmusia sp. IMI 367209]